jgi:hypothetical protein
LYTRKGLDVAKLLGRKEARKMFEPTEIEETVAENPDSRSGSISMGRNEVTDHTDNCTMCL